MELDELKSHWKEISFHSADLSFDKSEIHQMITMQSKTLMSAAQRKLRLKANVGTLIGLFVLILAIASIWFKESHDSLIDGFIPDKTRYYMMVFMSLFILFISWYNRHQYRMLRGLERSSYNMKEALKITTAKLHNVMKASILSDTIGAPVLVFWITYIQLYRTTTFVPDSRLFTLLGITLVSIPIMYFIARIGQQSKYGAHLQALKQCLSELDTSPAKHHEHAS